MPFMPLPYQDFFKKTVDAIRQEGRYRVFTPVIRQCGSFPDAIWHAPDGTKRPITVWCSNDYLGMGQNESVRAAMQGAVDIYGTGSGGTRNISGSTPLHVALEQELASLHQKQSALVFNSGYTANAGALAALARILPNPIFFSDKENHASIIDGLRSSRAEKRIFRHNDPDHLRELLAAAPKDASKIVVFESVYSMDGSVAPLSAMLDVAERYNAFTYLDEVHAVGLYGATGGGMAERDNVLARVSLIQGTLGKAFGMVGGYIASDQNVVDAIRSTAPGFIFTTSLPPVIMAGALESVRLVRQSPELRVRHQEAVQKTRQAILHAGLPLLSSASHILPLHIGNARMAKDLSDELLKNHGIYLQPINYPTVPKGQERFRITPNPLHQEAHIAALVTALQSVLRPSILEAAE